MTPKTATDYVKTGLPFVAGLAIGTYVSHKISKNHPTLALITWGAFAAFGLGWSIAVANKGIQIPEKTEASQYSAMPGTIEVRL